MATRAIDTQLGEMDLNAGRGGRIDRIIAWLEQLPVPAIVWLAVVFLIVRPERAPSARVLRPLVPAAAAVSLLLIAAPASAEQTREARPESWPSRSTCYAPDHPANGGMEPSTRVVGRAPGRNSCSGVGGGHGNDFGIGVQSGRRTGIRSGLESLRTEPSGGSHRGNGSERHFPV